MKVHPMSFEATFTFERGFRNQVFSDREYLKQGFLPCELEDIRNYDVLFNLDDILELNNELRSEMFQLGDKLKL